MRVCKVCHHAARKQVEDALLKRTPARAIAEQYHISQWSISRHSKHLSRSITVNDGATIVDRVSALCDRFEAIAQKATSRQDHRCAVAALREIRETLALIARLTGQFPTASPSFALGVSVNVSAERSTHVGSNDDLDYQIAEEVSQATNGFDAATITKFKRLLSRQHPSRLLELENVASRTLDIERLEGDDASA
jgi:hypothetical protein